MKKIILFLFFLSSVSFSFTKIYTVQVSSYFEKNLEMAVKEAQFLENQGYKEVRVEKINGVFTVRVGKYHSFEKAKVVEKKLEKYFPSSFSRSAYFIKERVIYPVKENVVKMQSRESFPIDEKEKINEEENIILSRETVIKEKNEDTPPEKKKNRIELSTSYEILDPSEPYTRWKNINLSYYRIQSDTFTYFITVENLFREKGEDTTVFTLGSYKDWNKSFYTYTAVSFGSDSIYAPKFRFDNDFNFKFGEGKNIVWTVGATYIKYFDVHKDYIISTGFTLYLKNLILSYRIFRNESDPGSINSYSHSISIESGREKWRWLYLTFSFGHQAYTTTYLTTPEEIRNRSYTIDIGWKKWINDNWGIFGNIGYFRLLGEYKKYNINSGIFTEF